MAFAGDVLDPGDTGRPSDCVADPEISALHLRRPRAAARPGRERNRSPGPDGQPIGSGLARTNRVQVPGPAASPDLTTRAGVAERSDRLRQTLRCLRTASSGTFSRPILTKSRKWIPLCLKQFPRLSVTRVTISTDLRRTSNGLPAIGGFFRFGQPAESTLLRFSGRTSILRRRWWSPPPAP